MGSKPKLLQTRILAQSQLFTIEALDLAFSNGEQRVYERIRGNRSKNGESGSVMIVPLLTPNQILLVREYAAGVDDYLLAFPKGGVASGEDALVTADRELMEEAGYGARRLTQLAIVSTSPGYMTSKMTIVLAEDLYPQRLPGDEPEALEVVPWQLDQLDTLLAHPEFHEARSQAALLLLQRHLTRG